VLGHNVFVSPKDKTYTKAGTKVSFVMTDRIGKLFTKIIYGTAANNRMSNVTIGIGHNLVGANGFFVDTIMRHELGHLMGLDHDDSNLMQPYFSISGQNRLTHPYSVSDRHLRILRNRLNLKLPSYNPNRCSDINMVSYIEHKRLQQFNEPFNNTTRMVLNN
jgi:hypothetical protein